MNEASLTTSQRGTLLRGPHYHLQGHTPVLASTRQLQPGVAQQQPTAALRVHDQSPRMEQPSNNQMPLTAVAPARPVAGGQREGTCDPEGDEARKDSLSEEEEDAHWEEMVCQWKGLHRAAVARDRIVKLCPVADPGVGGAEGSMYPLAL